MKVTAGEYHVDDCVVCEEEQVAEDLWGDVRVDAAVVQVRQHALEHLLELLHRRGLLLLFWERVGLDDSRKSGVQNLVDKHETDMPQFKQPQQSAAISPTGSNRATIQLTRGLKKSVWKPQQEH